MKNSILLILIIFTNSLFSQNPIVPPGVYLADPAAHVWPDGKLYIYGSLDESTEYYCSWRHHVLETRDLKSWIIHENCFAAKGENDQVPYNNSLLFAPDCMYRDGKYFLYYCQPDRGSAEGVAVSDRPIGPFLNGKPIDTHGYNQIDPCVFTDDDGQTYYVWGQFTLKMARLKPNMTELDASTVRDSVLTEKEHYFHEGAFMTKRNGIYYLVYADLSRAGMPTCLGYATSDQPTGPYHYRGVIIDNDHCDPANWNNHGSIVEFNGQWYVFYHRATHNSNMMRRACVEPIEFRDDGAIPEVEMTSQGAGLPLDAKAEIDAARACVLLGKVHVELAGPGNEVLAKITHEDRAGFKYINFGQTTNQIILKVKPGLSDGTISVRRDMPWGPKLADVPVPAGNDGVFISIAQKITPVSGVHALWLNFYSQQPHQKLDLALDSFWFE